MNFYLISNITTKEKQDMQEWTKSTKDSNDYIIIPIWKNYGM